VINNGIPIAKAIAASILKFIVQYNPPAIDFENIIQFAKKWDSDSSDAIGARFLTILNSAIKRSLTISGKQYMQTGSTIVSKEATTDVMRDKETRDNFVANSEAGAKNYRNTMLAARADAIANRQERLSKMKEKDDLWAKFAHRSPTPQIGTRTRKLQSPLPMRTAV
jgi:hypothetical protein